MKSYFKERKQMLSRVDESEKGCSCHVLYFDIYLILQQKFISDLRKLAIKGIYFFINASLFSSAPSFHRPPYQSRRDRSALARSAAKSREVKGQIRLKFWLSLWKLHYTVAFSCVQLSRFLRLMYLYHQRPRCYQSWRCFRVYLA